MSSSEMQVFLIMSNGMMIANDDLENVCVCGGGGRCRGSMPRRNEKMKSTSGEGRHPDQVPTVNQVWRLANICRTRHLSIKFCRVGPREL